MPVTCELDPRAQNGVSSVVDHCLYGWRSCWSDDVEVGLFLQAAAAEDVALLQAGAVHRVDPDLVLVLVDRASQRRPQRANGLLATQGTFEHAELNPSAAG